MVSFKNWDAIYDFLGTDQVRSIKNDWNPVCVRILQANGCCSIVRPNHKTSNFQSSKARSGANIYFHQEWRATRRNWKVGHMHPLNNQLNEKMYITSARKIISLFQLGCCIMELRFVTVQGKFDLHLATFFGISWTQYTWRNQRCNFTAHILSTLRARNAVNWREEFFIWFRWKIKEATRICKYLFLSSTGITKFRQLKQMNIMAIF